MQSSPRTPPQSSESRANQNEGVEGKNEPAFKVAESSKKTSLGSLLDDAEVIEADPPKPAASGMLAAPVKGPKLSKSKVSAGADNHSGVMPAAKGGKKIKGGTGGKKGKACAKPSSSPRSSPRLEIASSETSTAPSGKPRNSPRVRLVSTPGYESATNAGVTSAAESSLRGNEANASSPHPVLYPKTKTRPLLAGLAMPGPATPATAGITKMKEAAKEERSDSDRSCQSGRSKNSGLDTAKKKKGGKLKRGKTKKKTMGAGEKGLKFEEGCKPAAPHHEINFSFSFRFLNYNMANQTDLSLQDVGSGFAAMRERSETTSPPKAAAKSVKSNATLMREGRRSTSLPTPRRPVSLSMLVTEGVDRAEEASSTNDCGDDPLTGLRDPLAASQASSSPKALNKQKTTTFLRKAQESISPAGFLRRRTGKQKTMGAGFFDPPNRNATTTVDCVFGAFEETQFPLEEFAKVMEDLQGQAHFHTSSALQHICDNSGQIQAMKGKVAGKWCGDMKAFMLCRRNMEEVEDGEVFCSYDEHQGNQGNPIKSFVGQTFDAACGAVRFVFLGTHFPMKTTAALMEDPMKSKEESLQKGKCLMARLLQKILRHLLLRDLINPRTVIVVQGDLNSRCMASEGKYVDLLNETLKDSRLQNFICMDLPLELRGEWREVVDCKDPGELPATYRFAMDSTSVAEETRLRMRDIYGTFAEESLERTFQPPDQGGKIGIGAREDGTVEHVTDGQAAQKGIEVGMRLQIIDGEAYTKELLQSTLGSGKEFTIEFKRPLKDAPADYRQVLQNLRGEGTLQEWGLYSPKLENDGGKFKPSRLPACTERVIYFSPSSMQDKCRWVTARGYEVNYLHGGSDHRPVMLEATLNIGKEASNAHVLSSQSDDPKAVGRGSEVPEDFERYLSGSDNDSGYDSHGSDNSDSGKSDYSSNAGGPRTMMGSLMTRASAALQQHLPAAPRRQYGAVRLSHVGMDLK